MLCAQEVWTESLHVQTGLRFRRPPLGHSSGKRTRRSLVSAGPPPINNIEPKPFIIHATSPTTPTINAVTGNKCFTLYDATTGQAYLADSGAAMSVFPASPADRRRGQTGDLAAANSTCIKTWGKRNIHLKLGNRDFWQEFVIADVSRPILGADFFTT